MDEKENTVSSPVEKTTSSPLTPLTEAAKTISGINTINLPQIASLRLKPAKSIDSLTHHPLLNNDDEESDVISTWSSQRSRRSSSTSSSSSLQPRFSTHPVPGGSVGGLMLTKLREMNASFSDIVHMLISKKATLLLPASPVMPFENVDRTYLEDHIVFSQSTEDGTKVITLNGVRAFIQQDVFKAVGLIPTEQVDIENRKSLFDAFSKPSDFSYDYPLIKILNNYSDIHLHGMPIQTIVIESPVRTKEIAERIATRTEMEKKVEGSDLPESLLEEIHNFNRDFVKNLPKNEDSSIDQIQVLFDHVRCEIESQVGSDGELTEANENDINETMNTVEKYVCTALYDNIFSPKWSNDDSDDEALSSKIAALNLSELGLSNLGVDIKPQQQDRIGRAVQTAGEELQHLEQKKSPHEKLNGLIQCHRIVVEALEKKTPSSNYKTSAQSKNSYVASPPTDILPASIPLPPSPTLSTSPNIPITPISPKLPMSPTFPTSPTDEKHGFGDPNADAIFPLLIFIVVKSNPKKLISNLRFMSRYRVRSLLCGESAYCLTNIMAVVQFLENTEYMTLGLSSDNVLSESINTNSSLEQRTRKVGQEIAGAADSGLKVITGVMDSSVKMFGRLIGYNENASTGTNSSLMIEKSKENSALTNTDTNRSEQNYNVNDIKMNPGLPEGAVRELAEINTTKNNIIHSEETSPLNVNEETKSLAGRILPFNVLPRFSSDRNHTNEEQTKGQKVNKPVNKISPPIQKFLDCPIDEFRVNDVPELLADYKRLANAIRDFGLYSS